MASSRMTQTTLQILLSLTGGPRHGYGLEAIQRLEEEGWIRPVPPPDDDADPRRQYYRLERAGETALREELARLDAVVGFARSRDLLPRPEES